MKIYVTNRGFAVHNGSPNSHDRTKVWARPGGNVTFVIENHDADVHEVRIPTGEFVPSTKPQHGGDATPEPLVAANSVDAVTVPAGEVRLIQLPVKPAAHFGFDRREPWKSDRETDPSHKIGMTYKYNIYTRSAKGGEIALDPDLEIKP